MLFFKNLLPTFTCITVFFLAFSSSGVRGDDIGNDFSLWEKSFQLRGSLGYKDNVLLSARNTQESPFWSTGAELMFFRLPIDGTHTFFFLTGEDQRYLKNIDTDREQSLIALGKVQKEIGQNWKPGVELRYLYQDQVFDVSVTERDLTTLQLTGHNIRIAPSVEWNLPGPYRADFEFPLSRQFLSSPLDDYWEGAPQFGIRREYGHRSSLFLTYTFSRRFYDTRRDADRDGNLLPGTSLVFQQQQIELGQRHFWGESRKWRTDARLSFRTNRDRNSGYFDYERYRFSPQLSYRGEGWNARARAHVQHYEYSQQRAGPDDNARRRRTGVGFNLRAEKDLFASLKLFAEFDHDQARSNRESNEFRANIVLTGIEWQF